MSTTRRRSAQPRSSQQGHIRSGLSVQELKAMTAMRMGVQETPTPNLENNLRSYQTANPQQLMAAGLLQTNNQQNGSRASNQSRGQVQTRMMSGSEVISPQAISVNELKELTRQRLSRQTDDFPPGTLSHQKSSFVETMKLLDSGNDSDEDNLSQLMNEYAKIPNESSWSSNSYRNESLVSDNYFFNQRTGSVSSSIKPQTMSKKSPLVRSQLIEPVITDYGLPRSSSSFSPQQSNYGSSPSTTSLNVRKQAMQNNLLQNRDQGYYIEENITPSPRSSLLRSQIGMPSMNRQRTGSDANSLALEIAESVLDPTSPTMSTRKSFAFGSGVPGIVIPTDTTNEEDEFQFAKPMRRMHSVDSDYHTSQNQQSYIDNSSKAPSFSMKDYVVKTDGWFSGRLEEENGSEEGLNDKMFLFCQNSNDHYSSSSSSSSSSRRGRNSGLFLGDDLLDGTSSFPSSQYSNMNSWSDSQY